MKDDFYPQSWLTLVEFLQFPDCKNWIEGFLAENIDLSTSNFTRIEDDFNYQFIEFNGILIYLLDEKIYKVKIDPFKIKNLKMPIKLFDVSLEWIDAIQLMNFYDFLMFIKEKKIPSFRLFDFYQISHEPVIKISHSNMIIGFSENEPYKFENIFLYFNSSKSPLNMQGIPIISRN